MDNLLKSFAVFLVGGLMGYYIAFNSWGGLVYFYPSDQVRNPAAIRNVFDFSDLKGTALKQASEERLISDIKVVKSEKGVGFELGNFVKKNSEGKKEFACVAYDVIKLKFQAIGVLESGVPPELVLEGQCKIGNNLNRISAVWLPVDKLKKEKPGDFEIQFWDEKSSVYMVNMGTVWPEKWELSSVKHYSSEDSSKSISVNKDFFAKIKKEVEFTF